MLGVPRALKTSGGQQLVPVPPISLDDHLQHLFKGLTEAFHQTVHLWMVHTGPNPNSLQTSFITRDMKAVPWSIRISVEYPPG